MLLPKIVLNPQRPSFCFSRCLDYVLEEIEHNRKANVMVATHNEDTVKFTLEKYGAFEHV